MDSRFCESQQEFDERCANLKTTPCPHCQRVGTLIRHGFLRGYDENHQHNKTVRAWRIYCSNRKRSPGCGRTFSVWFANNIKRLFWTANALWTFLKQAVQTGNKFKAFENLNGGLSDSAPYRIWKRFLDAQSAIRTALARICRPPQIASQQPAELTLAHLETAFPDHPCPIAAFQISLNTFFI